MRDALGVRKVKLSRWQGPEPCHRARITRIVDAGGLEDFLKKGDSGIYLRGNDEVQIGKSQPRRQFDPFEVQAMYNNKKTRGIVSSPTTWWRLEHLSGSNGGRLPFLFLFFSPLFSESPMCSGMDELVVRDTTLENMGADSQFIPSARLNCRITGDRLVPQCVHPGNPAVAAPVDPK